jgi:hypothetical protein
MNVEVTYGRAAKVWLSYFWRSLLLTSPLIVGYLVLVTHLKQHAGSMTHEELRSFLRWVRLYGLVFMVLAALLNIVAMRWMLRSGRWRDFRLESVSGT